MTPEQFERARLYDPYPFDPLYEEPRSRKPVLIGRDGWAAILALFIVSALSALVTWLVMR